MLKIRAVKIEVNTSDGLYGAVYQFSNGLNIIRGDNSTGKSSLFQSILYGLGFEELLGGKNEKTMQSVLKDQVEFPKGVFHNVIQSFIYVEIENKEIITIKRSVVSESRKSQLVDVFFGAFITGPVDSLSSRSMYLHDKGGASDEIYGYHLFLAEFLEWNLPEITNSKGDSLKLYLQQIAPAFIIEQKSGWSDFFSTMPYYGMRNTESRVIEFLLNLDVFKNEKQKYNLNISKQQHFIKWHEVYLEINRLTEKCGGRLNGLNSKPEIINNFDSIYININDDSQDYSLMDYTVYLKNSLLDLEHQQVPTFGKNVKKIESDLYMLTNQLNQVSLTYDILSPELLFDREKLKQYILQLEAVQEDLRKNKGALKIKSLGATLPAITASDICPVCHQGILDSLLPTDITHVPMRIEDNISFLDANKKMIEAYIDGQKRTIFEKEKKLKEYQDLASKLRQDIRNLKKELIQDERLPSSLLIEKKILLKKKIDDFVSIIDEYSSAIDKLKILSSDYENILSEERNLPKEFFSSDDILKLDLFNKNFISLLKIFNYQSKPFNAIKIAYDNYLPVAQKLLGEQLFYNIKFDSSASDFIRCIWAYFTAILKTSLEFKTSHPMLLMFDEPKQQDISIENFRTFLNELSQYVDQQIMVFASFENSDSAFDAATNGLAFSLNKIDNKLIKPLSV